MGRSLSKRLLSEIRALKSRHGRKSSTLCVCDGLRACSELIALVPERIVELIVREGEVFDLISPVEPIVLSSAEFDSIAPTVNSQGIMVVAEKPDYISLSEPLADDFVLVLDRVGDPGNFGTILRTARAVGLREVWLTRGCVDPFSDKVLRSASGSQFAVKLRMAQSVEELAKALALHDVNTIFRTLPAGGENLFTVPSLFDKTAVVFGCEATGVAEIDESRSLHIPMPGDTESLNVAQAATVVLFEYVRRKISPGT